MVFVLTCHSRRSLQMNSEEAWNMQEKYAKSRLVWQLAILITNSTHGVISNLLDSSLTNYSWLDEEEAQIKKIANVLQSIHEQMQLVETLSERLITTYKRPSLYQPTLVQNQTTTEDGVANSNKPECPPPPAA